jgi:hypothetical protein
MAIAELGLLPAPATLAALLCLRLGKRILFRFRRCRAKTDSPDSHFDTQMSLLSGNRETGFKGFLVKFYTRIRSGYPVFTSNVYRRKQVGNKLNKLMQI